MLLPLTTPSPSSSPPYAIYLSSMWISRIPWMMVSLGQENTGTAQMRPQIFVSKTSSASLDGGVIGVALSIPLGWRGLCSPRQPCLGGLGLVPFPRNSCLSLLNFGFLVVAFTCVRIPGVPLVFDPKGFTPSAEFWSDLSLRPSGFSGVSPPSAGVHSSSDERRRFQRQSGVWCPLLKGPFDSTLGLGPRFPDGASRPSENAPSLEPSSLGITSSSLPTRSRDPSPDFSVNTCAEDDAIGDCSGSGAGVGCCDRGIPALRFPSSTPASSTDGRVAAGRRARRLDNPGAISMLGRSAWFCISGVKSESLAPGSGDNSSLDLSGRRSTSPRDDRSSADCWPGENVGFFFLLELNSWCLVTRPGMPPSTRCFCFMGNLSLACACA